MWAPGLLQEMAVHFSHSLLWKSQEMHSLVYNIGAKCNSICYMGPMYHGTGAHALPASAGVDKEIAAPLNQWDTLAKLMAILKPFKRTTETLCQESNRKHENLLHLHQHPSG